MTGFELEEFHRDIPDEELLNDLHNVAKTLEKQKLTSREYDKHGRFSSSTVSSRFGGWNAALSASGLNIVQERSIPCEDLFENIADVWLKLGRQPKYRDLSKHVSAYSANTYAYRFGSWRKGLEKFQKWANQKDLEVPESKNQAPRAVKRTPRTANARLKVQVLMRDGAICRLCGSPPNTGAILHIDHVIPWSKGGETILENLQVLCAECNLGKGNFDFSR